MWWGAGGREREGESGREVREGEKEGGKERGRIERKVLCPGLLIDRLRHTQRLLVLFASLPCLSRKSIISCLLGLLLVPTSKN